MHEYHNMYMNMEYECFWEKIGKEVKSATGTLRLNMRQSKERHCVNDNAFQVLRGNSKV